MMTEFAINPEKETFRKKNAGKALRTMYIADGTGLSNFSFSYLCLSQEATLQRHNVASLTVLRYL